MKVRSAKSLSLFLPAVLLLAFLTACGVLEVGIESMPTPGTSTPPPSATPSPTSVVPTPTTALFSGQLKPGQSVKIIQIRMLDEANGWGIGQVETDLNDHILFTADGGRSWQDRTPPDALLNSPAEGLAAVAFFGAAGNAWVTYTSQIPQSSTGDKLTIWQTADNGDNWQVAGTLQNSDSQPGRFTPSNLGFIDPQHGWVMVHVGTGTDQDAVVVFTTSDGGRTWQQVVDAAQNPDLMACAKTGLAFSTATNGWLTGSCPDVMDHLFLYFTVNGGQTWQRDDISPPSSQAANLFSSSKAGCGVPGLLYLTARSILLTVRCEFYDTKYSAAWLYAGKAGGTLETYLLPMPFGAVDFINSDEAWMVGTQQDTPNASGEIYHTINGGQYWLHVISTAWQGTPDFINATTGWVVARSSDKLALVFTSDGARSWLELSPVIVR